MMKRIAALLLALVLMVPAVESALAADKKLSANGSMIIGSYGDGIKHVQQLLKDLGYFSGNITGKYNSATAKAVKWFQRSNNLKDDGVVGAKTLAVLEGPNPVAATDTVAKSVTDNGSLVVGSTGDKVQQVQVALTNLGYYSGPTDGLYSTDTEAAVKAFQKRNGLKVDGKVGYNTEMKLLYNYPTPAAAAGQTTNGSLGLGSSGADVANIQQLLKNLDYYEGTVNGEFDAATEAAVKLFQTRNGLKADGLVGPKTLSLLSDPAAIKKTDAAVPNVTLAAGSHGLDVQQMQQELKYYYFYTGKVDGVFGSDMTAAVKMLQAAAGLTQDGKIGAKTRAVINGLPGSLKSYPIRTLRLNSRGYDVYNLQVKLIDRNYLSGVYTKGLFDKATEKAVKKAQKALKITQDGVYGSTLRRYLWPSDVATDDDLNTQEYDDNLNFVGKVLKQGSSGEQVKYVQMKLKSNGFLLDDADGVFGESTYKAVLTLQKLINKFIKDSGSDEFIKEDGIVGEQTWAVLRDSSMMTTLGAEPKTMDTGAGAIGAITRKLRQGSNGSQVKRLQKMLADLGKYTGTIDGFFGPQTKQAVKDFQHDMGIKEDGVVGTVTLYYLQLAGAEVSDTL